MKKVIIVGASYAGLYAAKSLLQNKDIQVQIFDKNKYHYIQVESYRFVALKDSIADVTIDIEQYISKLDENIKFYKKEISSFCAESKTIKTIDKESFSYDYLIIATGSLTNFPIQVPNIKKYSKGVKTLQSASQINQTFNSILNEVILRKYKEINKPYNIAIGGAGLSGVEIAAEMAIYLKNKLSSSNLDLSNVNISIIDGMPTVLPNMDKRLVSTCKKRLEALSISLHLGSFIKDVDEKKIYLANEKVIDYDYFIFTGGIKANTLNSSKSYKVNKLNQYIVNGYFNLIGEQDIFAVGDSSEIMIEDKYMPPSAQIAIKSGEYVASYIKNKISNKKNEKFNFKPKGVLISLGGNYAIGLLNGKFFIKGALAHLTKNIVTSLHKRNFL